MPRSTVLRTDRGATLVEYALLVALIAVAAIAALSILGDNSAAAFDEASAAVSGEVDSNGGPGPSDPGPSDPGPSDPGPSDPGPSDPGPSDPGPSDPGPSNPDPNDPGPGPDDDAEVGGEDAENDDEHGDGGDHEDGTPEPPQVTSSFTASSASRAGNSHNWTAEANLLISGTDGKPLAGSVDVAVKVIERGRDHKNRVVENVSIRTIRISNGSGSITDSVRDSKPNKNHDAISSITYQVVSVASGSGAAWDGTAPTITILAP